MNEVCYAIKILVDKHHKIRISLFLDIMFSLHDFPVFSSLSQGLLVEKEENKGKNLTTFSQIVAGPWHKPTRIDNPWLGPSDTQIIRYMYNI